MENALGILWISFIDSPLSLKSTLIRMGVTEHGGGYGFPEWDGESDLYADSSVFLHYESGCHFNWSISVLFEQGKNNGIRWQHGVAYARVTIFLQAAQEEQMCYDIKSIQLPDDFGGLASVSLFAKNVEALSYSCLDDLEYVFETNSLQRLIQLSRERIESFNSFEDPDASYSWKVNPLMSSPLRS